MKSSRAAKRAPGLFVEVFRILGHAAEIRKVAGHLDDLGHRDVRLRGQQRAHEHVALRQRGEAEALAGIALVDVRAVLVVEAEAAVPHLARVQRGIDQRRRVAAVERRGAVGADDVATGALGRRVLAGDADLGDQLAEHAARDVARVGELERGVMAGAARGLLDAAERMIEEEQAAELAPLLADGALRGGEVGLAQLRRAAQSVVGDQRLELGIDRPGAPATVPSSTAPGQSQRRQ